MVNFARKQELKSGWKWVKFGDVVKLSTARCNDPLAQGIERYVGLEHIDSDDLRIQRWGLVEDGITFTSLFKPGQVLFGKRRAYLRKVAVPDFAGVCSGDIYVFESANPQVLLPELLPFICQTDRFFEYAIGTSAGSLSPRTNWKSLVNFEFTLPPLKEQIKLINILERSQLTVDAFMRASEELKLLHSSLSNNLCNPKHGIKTKLGEICKMQNGKAFPSKYYQKEGILLLRPGNLGSDGYFNWKIERTVCLDKIFENQACDYLIQAGDVVINLTAQSLEDGFMGRVCLAKENDRSLLNQRIGRFVFNNPEVLPEFIFRILQTSKFQQHTVSMCEGTKVKHLFWSHIASFTFNLPCLEYQKKVVFQLRQSDLSIKNLFNKANQQQQFHNKIVNTLVDNKRVKFL